MYLLILLWQLAVNHQPFYLDADLKRAKHVLRDEHGVWLTKEDKPYTLKAFEPYAKMNLAKFNFSSKRVGKYNISAWKLKGKRKLEIYQVETKLHVDTATTILIDMPHSSKQYIQKTPINVDSLIAPISLTMQINHSLFFNCYQRRAAKLFDREPLC